MRGRLWRHRRRSGWGTWAGSAAAERTSTSTTLAATSSICVWLMLAKRPRTVATPKGHALDYDEWGELIGAVLLNARFQLE